VTRLFECILVPVNGSAASVCAAKLAIEIAKEHGSLLVFVHVVDIVIRDQMARLSGTAPRALQREMEADAEDYLNYAAHLAEAEGLRAEKVRRVGFAHAEILDEVESRGVSLVVIGMPIHHGPRGEFFTRRARRVIETVPCPVLVAKTKE